MIISLMDNNEIGIKRDVLVNVTGRPGKFDILSCDRVVKTCFRSHSQALFL